MLALPIEKKKNKFRAVRTEVNGIMFASKKEAKRYSDLRYLELSGEITRLVTQKRYKLAVNGKEICVYVADFVYEQNGRVVVEDVKGYKAKAAWDVYRLKRELFKALHPEVEFVEI